MGIKILNLLEKTRKGEDTVIPSSINTCDWLTVMVMMGLQTPEPRVQMQVRSKTLVTEVVLANPRILDGTSHLTSEDLYPALRNVSYYCEIPGLLMLMLMSTVVVGVKVEVGGRKWKYTGEFETNLEVREKLHIQGCRILNAQVLPTNYDLLILHNGIR